jgi:hypothetical protein
MVGFLFAEIAGRTFRVSVIAEEDVPDPAPTEHPLQFLDVLTLRLIFGGVGCTKGVLWLPGAGGGGGGGGGGRGGGGGVDDGLFPIVSIEQNKYREETR